MFQSAFGCHVNHGSVLRQLWPRSIPINSSGPNSKNIAILTMCVCIWYLPIFPMSMLVPQQHMTMNQANWALCFCFASILWKVLPCKARAPSRFCLVIVGSFPSLVAWPLAPCHPNCQRASIANCPSKARPWHQGAGACATGRNFVRIWWYLQPKKIHP